ncbi:MAG TPA: hypothetical protein PLW86_14010 [Rhodocyclaceae bacterium]|nr:hypothetical protein [Rhodocyclaceae bacterium]
MVEHLAAEFAELDEATVRVAFAQGLELGDGCRLSLGAQSSQWPSRADWIPRRRRGVGGGGREAFSYPHGALTVLNRYN